MNRASHPDRLARLDVGTLRVKHGWAITTMRHSQNREIALHALIEKYDIERELAKRGVTA